MAGWEAWLNQLLTRSVQGQPVKSAHHAGIFGFDGSCWCGTDGMMKSLPKSFFEKVEVGLVEGVGGCSSLLIGNTKYMVLRADISGKSLIAKKGSAGFTIAKGKQSYVIGVYDSDEILPSNNNTQIIETRDKLADSGY
ncbi:profilin-1-like [Gigantopelta aegis]|uniref:profilin-1-like n=1 Tax=Gigantopelta aegis TaxID=1735272 RepID=UPI001B88E72B|nr:profilin-1-like [Gigantopelta aegis]